MNREIEAVLYYWLQSVHSMRVRRIRLGEGRDRLQINLENTVFYRLLRKGRPDGFSAKGFGTYLHLYKNEVRSKRQQGEEKRLTAQEQRHLEEELLSYFPRALAFLKLGEYKSCARDLLHCIEVARFSSKYSKGNSSAEGCLEMMPTLHMTYYFALSAMSLGAAKSHRALYYLNCGVQRIAVDYLRIPMRSAGSYSEEALRLSSFKEVILKDGRTRSRRYTGASAAAVIPQKSPHEPICRILSQQRRPAAES